MPQSDETINGLKLSKIMEAIFEDQAEMLDAVEEKYGKMPHDVEYMKSAFSVIPWREDSFLISLILFWRNVQGKRTFWDHPIDLEGNEGAGAAFVLKHPYRDKIIIENDYRIAMEEMNEYYDSGER